MEELMKKFLAVVLVLASVLFLPVDRPSATKHALLLPTISEKYLSASRMLLFLCVMPKTHWRQTPPTAISQNLSPI